MIPIVNLHLWIIYVSQSKIANSADTNSPNNFHLPFIKFFNDNYTLPSSPQRSVTAFNSTMTINKSHSHALFYGSNDSVLPSSPITFLFKLLVITIMISKLVRVDHRWSNLWKHKNRVFAIRHRFGSMWIHSLSSRRWHSIFNILYFYSAFLF